MLTQDTIERGSCRWQSFKKAVDRIDRRALRGCLLDVGCGRGEFVLAALEQGVAAHGIDVNTDGISAFQAHVPTYREACTAYDGEIFPFSTRTFSAIHSWFVFEHLAHPHRTISEISRVAKPGCVLVIHAQDGRTSLEAHAKIPWLPYLPVPLKAAWLEETTTPERARYISDCVFDTTGEEVRAVLQMFDWEIENFKIEGALGNPLPVYPGTVEETKLAAKQAMALFESNQWPRDPVNYRIRARKTK